MHKILILLLTTCPLLAATGSWNGIAFTQWNGIAQTAWNGTGISCAGGGGSPTQDNFDRANETPLAGNWTTITGESGTFNLSSNHVIPGNDNNDAAAYRSANPASFPNDGYVQVKVTTTSTGGGGQGGGVLFRGATAARTYYYAIVDGAGSNNVELGYFVAGFPTVLWNRTATYSAGALLKAVYTGTTLQVFYNGVQVGANTTDVIIASGKPGIRYSSVATATVLEDWEAQ